MSSWDLYNILRICSVAILSCAIVSLQGMLNKNQTFGFKACYPPKQIKDAFYIDKLYISDMTPSQKFMCWIWETYIHIRIRFIGSSLFIHTRPVHIHIHIHTHWLFMMQFKLCFIPAKQFKRHIQKQGHVHGLWHCFAQTLLHLYPPHLSPMSELMIQILQTRSQ